MVSEQGELYKNLNLNKMVKKNLDINMKVVELLAR